MSKTATLWREVSVVMEVVLDRDAYIFKTLYVTCSKRCANQSPDMCVSHLHTILPPLLAHREGTEVHGETFSTWNIQQVDRAL